MFFLIIAMLSLTAMANTGKMRLRGEYLAGEGEKLYLNIEGKTIDSVIVKKGRFEFRLKDLHPDEYLLSRMGKDGKMEVVLLYLDNYDTHLTLEKETYNLYNTHFIKHSVTGNPTHQAVSAANEILMNKLFKDVMEKQELKGRLMEVAERGDMASAIVLWKYAQAYDHIMSREQMENCLQNLAAGVKETVVGKRCLQVINAVLLLKPGAAAPDFTMNTPEGKSLSLQDFVKGKKVVLVDFWASWCAPCRKKNPEVVELYNQFHEKGLDVLGVSLDSDLEKWKQAIEDDKLPWTHISDLKGWKSDVCKLYKFSGIPYLVLLNGEGKILATGPDLRNNLRAAIEKFCK